MNKSHLGTADNPQEDVVTAHDIGRLVDVVNVGKGFLRYVGPIHGKEGLFCGIELLEPNGKHDGSFQGVSYFIATPQHGIFAPLFRVTLDADERPKPPPIPPTNRLSRSALPALQLRNPLTQERKPEEDVMSTSVYVSSTKPIAIPTKNCRPPETDPMQMSMFSDMMDGSMFSNGSWSDIGDSMITSNCTFTVRKGPLISNDDDDLMSMPMVQSVFNIDREALRREEQLQSSIVLGESRIGVEHLPIIEDEELETPLVETRTLPIPNDVNANLSKTTTNNTTYIEPPVLETPKVEIHQNGNMDNEDTEATAITPPSQQFPSSGGSMVSQESDSGSRKEDTKSDKPSGQHKQPPKMEEKVVSRKKEEAPMPPPPPKFPVKAKAPSKHQLMMEALKASIEAEKNKPKKEVKSRVSLLPPPAPKAQKENKEGGGEMTETPRRTITKTPLKTVNAKAKTSPAPPVERPKKERKPLYTPPAPKERVEKEKKLPPKAIVSPPSTGDKKPVVSSIPSTSSSLKGAFPTSSFAGGGKIQAPRKASTASSIASAKKQKVPPIDEKEKLARLHASNQAFDALIIVMNQTNEEKERKLGSISEQYEKKTSELGDLKKMLDEARKKFEEDVEQMKSNNQQVIRNHANTVENMQKTHEAQTAEKNKEFERNLEDERARREAEILAMNNRHQKVVTCLDEKIAEAEKQCDQLSADKKTLQAALANDCDHRNQMLTKEISSLQTALEMKSAEMKELRQKNQNLSLQVDEIPLKELEISKWKHKSNEYKQMLDQKINGEKILVQQIEELRRKQIHDEEEKEAMKRSFDLMQFKYENGDDPNVTSVMSAPMESRFSTPTKVQFRSRSSASGSRPISMATSNGDQRLSTSSHHDDSMNRSTISMYTSHIRLPENHADDVIYAPDEIISSRSGSISQRLAIAIEDDGEPILKNESRNASDSGIGLVM
ncbi:hypothetical protein GCK72_009393 [Caenorhabditis remanei]|uniref:CAP-Gly domain-containing protein n=1 Tax=Caenorhabditis remanei TaxID=31234 RepID=A0A6A5H2E3_CAERE|nr:hypothetical protein GCK72_009393 [Caenorhabditis remanei]KAF1761139.1 hypothetical protein GCK72_009393 [Caenorhabditis remanei]